MSRPRESGILGPALAAPAVLMLVGLLAWLLVLLFRVSLYAEAGGKGYYLPGAWTLANGKKLRLFDARKHLTRTFSQVKGKIGSIASIGDKSMLVSAQGGQLEVFTLRFDDGKKLNAPEFCKQAGLAAGTQLGA